VFIAANVQGQAALALGQHRRVAASWTLGCVVGIGLALVPGALSTRVEWSFLAGSLVVAVLLTATVRASVAQWRTRPATTNSL
jgi:uncharacterized membrane protein YgaE (UPF0421/DUF939 family)